MFKRLKGSGDEENKATPRPSGPDNVDVLEEFAELRAKVDRMK